MLNERFKTGGDFFPRKHRLKTEIVSDVNVSDLHDSSHFFSLCSAGIFDSVLALSFCPFRVFAAFRWRVDGPPGALTLTWRVSVVGRRRTRARRNSAAFSKVRGDRRPSQPLPLPRLRWYDPHGVARIERPGGFRLFSPFRPEQTNDFYRNRPSFFVTSVWQRGRPTGFNGFRASADRRDWAK